MSAREKYGDIIDLPHHVSTRHPQMSRLNRAAQFAPFAALTGYDDVVAEAGRFTETRLELDEEQILQINALLQQLQERIQDAPQARFTYFVPDEMKAGGAYLTLSGSIKKIDEYEQMVLMSNGVMIPFQEIYSLEILS